MESYKIKPLYKMIIDLLWNLKVSDVKQPQGFVKQLYLVFLIQNFQFMDRTG